MADPLAEDQLVEATAGMRINEAPRRLYWKKKLDESGAQSVVELPINAGNKQELPHISISLGPEGTEIPETFVFLGEGNFTFCTAFAAYRGSWQGIVPTNYYANGAVPADMQQAWNETIALNLQNSQNWQPVQNLQNMPAPPSRRHLDATDMGTRDDLLRNMGIPDNSAITLWFQCPWPGDGLVERFLKHMFSSAAGVQNQGELFLVGLCVDPSRGNDQGPYFRRYGQVTAAAGAAGYDCLGADQQFVGQMLELGYKHHSDSGNDLRLTRNDQFATLLFIKKHPASRVYIHGEYPIHTHDFGLYVTCKDDGRNEITALGDSYVQGEVVPQTLTRDQWLQLKKLIDNQVQTAQQQQEPKVHGQQQSQKSETCFAVKDGKLYFSYEYKSSISEKYKNVKVLVHDEISYLEWRNKSSQIDQLFAQQ